MILLPINSVMGKGHREVTTAFIHMIHAEGSGKSNNSWLKGMSGVDKYV